MFGGLKDKLDVFGGSPKKDGLSPAGIPIPSQQVSNTSSSPSPPPSPNLSKHSK
jgi:hypothetical protein